MKCFNHTDKESVAVCKRCGKALCGDCSMNYRGFLVCKDHAKLIRTSRILVLAVLAIGAGIAYLMLGKYL